MFEIRCNSRLTRLRKLARAILANARGRRRPKPEGLAPKAPPKAPLGNFALRALKASKKLKLFGACGGQRGTGGPQWARAFGAARINC